ncbi:MAG: hypothetical protein QG622_2677 [Actinomycetota bacterium]|nr:hypothetical protein [Actinomycetota bacterium]
MSTPPGPADTSGVPWAGRELAAAPFADDDGSADPTLAVVLAAASQGRSAVADVVRALAAARVFVPGRPEADGDLVIVTGADERRALPVFSSVATLTRWDGTARPVPVDCRRAAAAAVGEGCEVLLLDPSGPVRLAVPRPALVAIAEGRDWVSPSCDPELLAVLREAVHPLPDVLELHLERRGDIGVRVVLGIRGGLDGAARDAVIRAARALIDEVSLLPERADPVELRIR